MRPLTYILGIILFIGFFYWCQRALLEDELFSYQPCEKYTRCLEVNITYPYTLQREEKEFPIAYSILVFKDPERVIRLLLSIYRPNNFYCIHADRKTSSDDLNKMKRLTLCLGNNVFFVPDKNRVSVTWGYITVLQPEIICGRLLLNASKKWKYLINLTGQEFPLRTNWELVVALKALKGANVVEAINKGKDVSRFPRGHPFGPDFTWYKGSVHVCVRREYVEYMVNDPKAITLYNILNDYEETNAEAIISDETYFATLNHNPKVFPIPGAFTGIHEVGFTTGIIRTKLWTTTEQSCKSGVRRRQVCILGFQDIPAIIFHPTFFANKFSPDVEPEGYSMLETWIAYKVYLERINGRLHPSFNISFYEKHPFAWNHL